MERAIRPALLLYTEVMGELKYAIYPGTVTLYDGSVQSWTAAALVAAYGVGANPYIVINTPADEPKGMTVLDYIPLKPRADGYYEDHPGYAQDDGQIVTWGPDFDATKRYTMETDPRNIYPDENDEQKLNENHV